MNYWHVVSFTEDDEKSAQKMMNKRHSILTEQYGTYFKSDTIWTGHLGELAFKNYLDKMTLSQSGWEYEWFATEDKLDDLDFFVRDKKIDVKTRANNYFPKQHYENNINHTQLQKIEREQKIDTLVFCHYHLQSQRAIITGWIDIDTFKKRARKIEKGEQMNRISNATATLYCIKNADLRGFQRPIDP